MRSLRGIPLFASLRSHARYVRLPSAWKRFDGGRNRGLATIRERRTLRDGSAKRRPRSTIADALPVIAFSLVSFAAAAQSAPSESAPSTVFDAVTHWLTVLGEKTENLLTPRFGHIGDAGKSPWDLLKSQTREFEQSYPVRPACTVSITRDVGEGRVRVTTWDNPVVRVHITATAGAEQVDAAKALAESMKITVSPSPDLIDIDVDGPGARSGGGKTAIKLDYEITVPSGGSVTCKNDWGDTDISGVTGAVTIDSRFGSVDLRNIGGAVHARAWGEFPLRAYGLRQGGTFELQGTQSEFASVSGALKISNFMGSVSVRELPAETQLDVTCESGPIVLFIPENAKPEISASVAFGTIASDIKLDQNTRGDLAIARGGTVGSKQRLSVHASFSTITIHQEGVKTVAPAKATDSGELVRKNIEQSLEAPAGAELAIKAVVGDIRITPSDTPLITVHAAIIVQMQANTNAQAAIEALNVHMEMVDGRAMLTTAVRDNMEALGCVRYRIDLDVQCPRGSPLKVDADSGFTTVTGLSAPVTIDQGKGSVTVDRCSHDSGEIGIAIQDGDVSVTDSMGPLNVTTMQGAIATTGIAGKQVLVANRGRTTVELPKGEIDVHSIGGDVVILAQDGVSGDCKVRAENGDIRLVVPDTANATVFATAENGRVASKVRLTGSLQGDRQEFSGPIGTGTYRVDLSTTGGDINID